MPKTIKLKPYLGSEELEGLYRKAHDPVERSHYQIIWLISTGKTTTEVMEVTGYSRGWIQQLARRYNADGPQALGDAVIKTQALEIGRCSLPTNSKNFPRR
jgi:hypothetical protein